MIHNYKIKYENVYLRPLEEDDIENLRKWRNDPKNTLYLKKIPYISSQMQLDWFNRYLQNNDEICFAIVENQTLKRMVGSLSLYDFSKDTCFFGKILVGDEEAHGQKIGINSTMAATKIAFEQLGMKEVKLFVYANNLAAINTYEQSGFRIVDRHFAPIGEYEYTMIKRQED